MTNSTPRLLLRVFGPATLGFLVLTLALLCFFGWRPLGRVMAEANVPGSIYQGKVVIREFKKYELLIVDQIDPSFRFEEWNRLRLVSAVTSMIGSYQAKSAEVRWNSDGSCSCLLDGSVLWTLRAGQWTKSEDWLPKYPPED